jgi:hypothetical protein
MTSSSFSMRSTAGASDALGGLREVGRGGAGRPPITARISLFCAPEAGVGVLETARGDDSGRSSLAVAVDMVRARSNFFARPELRWGRFFPGC